MANITSRKDSRGRKLKEGESERKDGRYMYRYTDKKTGKRQTVYARDLADLREKEKAVSLDIYNDVRPDSQSKKTTVNELFQRHLETKEISESTRANYKTLWKRYLQGGLGEYRVVQLLPSDIKKFYAEMGRNGYANGTIKAVHDILHPVLELAVGDGIISKNPSKGAMGDYGYAKKEKHALTVQQQETLIKFVQTDSRYSVYAPLLTIMLGTGIRCGETCGLTWNDIDMDKREIRISHQLIYKDYGDGHKLHITSPKTGSGIRNIPMSEKVFQAFEEQKRLNAILEKGKKQLEIEGYTDFVFTARGGRPLLMDTVSRVLHSIVKAINAREPEQLEAFPPITPHTLRHTFCTRMAENGMNVKVLQYLMGHANISITMQVYTHVADMSRLEKEVAKIDTFTNGCDI